MRYTYANAAAGLAPLTTHTSLKNFVHHLKVRSCNTEMIIHDTIDINEFPNFVQKLYTEGDEVAHVTSAQCLQFLARKDVVKDHFKVVIPLVLLGKYAASRLSESEVIDHLTNELGPIEMTSRKRLVSFSREYGKR